MQFNEKVFLGVMVVAIAALILWRNNPLTASPVTELDSMNETNANLVKGPAYLMYNQPWYFGPDVAPFMPMLTAGAANQSAINPPQFSTAS